MDTLENICQGGGMNGHTFNISTAADKIKYRDGFYKKSAIKNETGQIVWHMKKGDEDE
tara:strand:+ start:891 stop:1064 length:174 start_codon:yes stop_codon:yes gene_type:complete